MKIIITGSLGHISAPLAHTLIQQNHEVVVISSSADRKNDIEAIGAKAAIGSVEDEVFLAQTFQNADAVYCMVPPNFAERDQQAYYERVGKAYVQAIMQTGVKRAVELSSYGAHLPSGTGYIVGSHRVEKIFDTLRDVAVTHIRPGYFYYNLLAFIKMVKSVGYIASNYGGDDRLALVAPVDFAHWVAEELTTAHPSSIRYAVSDDRSCSEIASVLGQAIGKPDLQWKTITNEQMQSGLVASGLPDHIAQNLVELGAAAHAGRLRGHYDTQTPVSGTISIEDFAREFAQQFNNK